MYDAPGNTLGHGRRDGIVDDILDVYYDGEWLTYGLMNNEYDCSGNTCIEIDYCP